jgi:putative transposase
LLAISRTSSSLTKREAYAKDKTNISEFEMKALVKNRRNEPNSAWKMLNAQTVQQIIERVYDGYALFFKNRKRGVKTSPPKPKKQSKYRSITFKQNGYKLTSGTIYIGGHEHNGKGGKKFKFHKHREIEGKVKTITLKRNPLGEWFLFITTDHQNTSPKQTRSGKSVGLDFGLKTFLVGSDGTKIQSPEFFKQSSREIKKLSKSVSKKQRGSNNRKRAKLDLARAYERIANQRKDFHWKLAYQLVHSYEAICLETLNLEGMKRLWGRKISDLGLYSFVQILQYMGEKYGCQIVFIDQWYPSSKTCSCCGWIKEDLDLQDREWDCLNCGAHHNRDENAATNIHRVGISTLAGAEVRPSETVRKNARKKALGVDRTISNQSS